MAPAAWLVRLKRWDMRWNGVYVLGIGLAVTGFTAAMALNLVDLSPLAHQRGMTISIAMMACGVLAACLGTVGLRRKTGAPARRRPGATLFGTAKSQSGTPKGPFGQRAAYGALPPMAQRGTRKGPSFKDPNAPVSGSRLPVAPLAITGPR